MLTCQSRTSRLASCRTANSAVSRVTASSYINVISYFFPSRTMAEIAPRVVGSLSESTYDANSSYARYIHV